MKSKKMFNKIIVVTISLVFLTLSVAPADSLAGPNKSSRNGYYKKAPRGSHWVNHGKTYYMVHQGRFYKPGRGGYVHTRPPRGLVLHGLPLAATLIAIAGITYYVWDDIYYRKIPAGYQVVDTPRQVVVVKSVQPGAQAVVTAQALNVRSGPGLNHSVQHLVYSNDQLIVQSSSGDWLYVQLPDNSYGWVMSRFVSITSPIAQG
jgi:uncharacterized protein YgiM (DUF1202 family)